MNESYLQAPESEAAVGSSRTGMARIVHITIVHPPFDVRIFHRECKSLIRMGYQVKEIAPHHRDEMVDGVQVMGIPKPSGRATRALRGTWSAYKRALEQPADLYHFHDPELILLGLLLRARGKPVVYDSHEDLAKDILDKGWIPPAIRGGVSRIAGLIERCAARKFSGIVAANARLAESFRRLNANVVAVENYPLLREFAAEPSYDRDRFRSGVIANFGGISPLRSIHQVVRAMSLVPEDLGARMILAGMSDSEALKDEVAHLPGSSRVEYRGLLPRAEVIAALSSAAMAVVLYSNIPNHRDVRSNRLFEALAAGAPVIAPNFGDWPKLVEGSGCGMSVDPDRPEDIAAGITYLLSQPTKAAEMGRRGRQLFRERFNWEREECKMLSFYERVLTGR